MQMRFVKKGRPFFPAVGVVLKRHHQLVLFVLLIAAIGGWSILFLEYGWRTIYEQPEITVRTVKIRADDLKAVLADMERRTEIQEQIQVKVFPNPFIEPPKVL